MTGWRIGYAAGPEEIISAMSKVQSQSTSNPTSISQKAAFEALTGPQDFTVMMVSEFDNRRRYIVKRLNKIDGITCRMPQGAFYVFPNVSKLFGRGYDGKKIRGSSDLSAYLLENAQTAVVSGDAFGADDYIRFSYATSMDAIRKGLDRIEDAIKALD
jgi:aspartate aminotransferase